MTRSALVRILAAAAAASGCASAQPEEPVVVVQPAPMMLIETTPAPATPRDDITEAQRREWFAAQQPQAYYVPQYAVERELFQEQPPCSHDSVPWWAAIPLSLSLGYWGGDGGHHDGHGWGVGLNWNNGWWGW